jgi:hypothetical protein
MKYVEKAQLLWFLYHIKMYNTIFFLKYSQSYLIHLGFKFTLHNRRLIPFIVMSQGTYFEEIIIQTIHKPIFRALNISWRVK